MISLGTILHALRHELNISKQELCRRTGFNQGYVYRLENNIINPTIQNTEKYCAALGIQLWQVILYSDHIKKQNADYTISLKEFNNWGEVADSGYKE